MTLLHSVIGAFLLNYFIYWFLGLFNLRQRQRTRFIVISIINLIELIFYIVNLIINIITLGFVVELILNFAIEIIALIFGYVLINLAVFDDIHIFKSRRSRRFLRAYNQTTRKHFVILVSIFALLSVLVISLGVALLVLVYKWYYYFIVAFGVIMLVITLFVYFTNRVSPNKDKNKHVLLLVKTDDANYLFKNHENVSIEESIKEFSDYYVIDFLGKINGPTSYLVYGVFTHTISADKIKLIQMERITDDKLISLMDNFQKTKKIKIDVDDNLTIKSTKEYK
jgi:hypothetical protein